MSSNVSALLDLLQGGITGQSQRNIMNTIAQFSREAGFISLLANAFASNNPLDNTHQLVSDWINYRIQAGILLKNTIAKAGPHLPQQAAAECANLSCNLLMNSPFEGNGRPSPVAEISCQVISKIVELRGLDFFGQCNIDIGGLLLNQLLGSGNEPKVLLGLRCLSFILEDAGEKLESGAFDIIKQVTTLVQNPPSPTVLQKSLLVLKNQLDIGKELNWDVTNKDALQDALLRAAGPVAACSTQCYRQLDGNTEEWAIESAVVCLQIWGHLVEYLDAILRMDGSEQDKTYQACIEYWVNTAAKHITSGMNAETAIYSLDFIGAIAYRAELVDPQEPAAEIMTPVWSIVTNHFNSLIPALLPCMIMKDEIIQETEEADNAESMHKAVKFSRKFTAQTDGMDEGAALSGLRDSASDCLNHLSKMEPQQVYQCIIGDIQKNFTSNDWKWQELAMCALGTIIDSCAEYLGNDFQGLVNFLAGMINNGQSPHQLVTSMNLWCLIKMTPTVCEHFKNLTGDVLSAALTAMETNKSRIQAAAVTLLKRLTEYGSAQYFHTQDVMVRVVNKLHVCLPEYKGNNLMLLCTAAKGMIELLTDDIDTMFSAVKPFMDRQQELAARFYSSAEERYGNSNNQVAVDYDVISVADVVAAACRMVSPAANETATENYTSWFNVCGTIKGNTNWDISDDSSMIGLPFHLCNMFCQGMTPESYTQCSNQMVTMAMELFDGSVQSTQVQEECMQTFVDALTYIGPNGIPSVDAIVNKLMNGNVLNVKDTPETAIEAAGLISVMFQTCGSSNGLVQVGAHLASQVRTDATDTTKMMPRLAAYLACCLEACPLMVQPAQLSDITLCVRDLSNDDEYKEQATLGIAAAYAAQATQQNADMMAQLAPSFMRLCMSWQKVRPDSCKLKCGNILSGLNQVAPQVVANMMNSIPENLRGKWINYWVGN